MMPIYSIVDKDGKVVGELSLYDSPQPEPNPPIVIVQRRVTAEPSLRIRESASTSSPVLGLLPYGALIDVIDGYGEWAKLATREGYVAGQYLEIISEPVPEPPEVPSVEAVPPLQLTGDSRVLPWSDGVDTSWMLADRANDYAPHPEIALCQHWMAAYWDRPVSSHPDAPIPRWLTYLDEGKQYMDVRWWRVVAASGDISADKMISNLRMMLDNMAQRGMKALLVLHDSPAQFRHREDDAYYSQASDGKVHKRWFHEERWRQYYWPWLERVVTEFYDHPGVGAWQLGNEWDIRPQPATDDDAEAVLNFFSQTANLIWEIDSTRPIFLGLESTRQIAAWWRFANMSDLAEWARYVYARLPNVHVGCHLYLSAEDAKWQGLEYVLLDRAAAIYHQRLFWVDEFGSAGDWNRWDEEDKFLLHWFIGYNIERVFRWGHMNEIHDAGCGDLVWGHDPCTVNNKAWYFPLRDLFSQWNTRILRVALRALRRQRHEEMLNGID